MIQDWVEEGKEFKEWAVEEIQKTKVRAWSNCGCGCDADDDAAEEYDLWEALAETWPAITVDEEEEGDIRHYRVALIETPAQGV